MGPTQGMEAPCLQEELAAGELGYIMMDLGHSIGATSDISFSLFFLGLTGFFREDLCSLLPGG